jgi:hypothetical protein
MAGMNCIGLRHGGHCAEWDSSTDGWLNGSRCSYREEDRNLFDAYLSLVLGVIERIALEQVAHALVLLLLVAMILNTSFVLFTACPRILLFHNMAPLASHT